MQVDNSTTALVTGAAGGIGHAIVAELINRGARRVYACDLAGSNLERTEAIDGDRVEVVSLDVTDSAAVTETARRCTDLDALFNVHGVVVHKGIIQSADIDPFRKEMEVNYWGTIGMCRAFADILGKNGGGAIANILSALALVTYPFCGPYCASKAAVRAITEAIRAELAVQGTYVASIYPGVIDTPMMAKFTEFTKSSPEFAASTILDGMASREEEIFVGPDAEEVRDAHAADRMALTRSTYSFLPGNFD